MKKSLLLLLFSFSIIFTACKDDSSTNSPANTDITVTAVAPTSGNAGTVVVITGTNFGTDKTALTVQFGSVSAVIDSVTNGTAIYTKVPDGIVTGDQQVKVIKSGITQAIAFNVLDNIVGTWLTDGANVAYGLRLAPFKVKKIVATFNANKSYTVVQTDSSNVTTTFTGTYTITESTNSDTLSTTGTKGAKIYSIVANQQTPSTVTANGIFAVSNSKMTYEVIQTSPALAGVSAPTALGGFGSTTIAGVKYAIYVQKYVKQ